MDIYSRVLEFADVYMRSTDRFYRRFVDDCVVDFLHKSCLDDEEIVEYLEMYKRKTCTYMIEGGGLVAYR